MRSDSDRCGRVAALTAPARALLTVLRRWLAAGAVLAVLAAGLAGGALAQPSAQPAVPPGTSPAAPGAAGAAAVPSEELPPGTPRLPATADASAASFRRALVGTTLLVGVSRTYPTLTIIDVDDPTTDPTIEQYRGNDQPGYTLAWRLGFDDEPFAATPLAGNSYTGWTLRIAAEVDTFTGKQTLLRRAVGQNAKGEITGNVIWGGVELLTLVAWENSVVPMAWTASAYIGLAAVQFQGDLEFTSSGVPYKGTAASDGLSLALIIPFELRWQMGPVALRHIWIDSQFAVFDQSAKVEYHGKSLAKAAYQYTIGITTLGYVFTF